MREILFRGKRVDNNQWVYGYYVVTPIAQHRIYLQPFKAATSNTYYNVHPESVGQYIGEKINDEEIYADDIIALYKKGQDTPYFIGKVTDHGVHGYTIDSKNDYMDFGLEKSYTYKKLGNKFDNPELLK